MSLCSTRWHWKRYSFDSGDHLSGPSTARSVSSFSRLFVLGIRLMNWICQSHLWPSFDLARFLQSWHQGFGWLTKHEAVTRLPIMGLDESRDPTLLSKDQFNHHRLETWSMVFAEAMGLSRQFSLPIRVNSKGGTLVLSNDCIRLSTFSSRPAWLDIWQNNVVQPYWNSPSRSAGQSGAY